MPAQSKFRFAIRASALLALLLAAAGGSGCTAVRQKNVVNWSPDQAVLPTADFYGNMITVHNIRNCDYRTENDYTVNYYDKTFDLNKIKEVDFIVVPFPQEPSLAHTMLSFGFEDEQYVGVSIEVRKKKGQTYDPIQGMLNEYQLMYVVGDEHDLIGLRTNYRKNDVYMYKTKATPEQSRLLFVDVMKRADKLSKEPEYYHTLYNNCTTNIARHIDDIAPGKFVFDYRVLINGYSDQLAYDLGLIDNSLPFEQEREKARITNTAYVARNSPDFSKEIRR